MPVIELQGLTSKTMEILLDCIYSEKVCFTTENVQEILPAAALLQLNGIVVSLVVISNVLTILRKSVQ